MNLESCPFPSNVGILYTLFYIYFTTDALLHGLKGKENDMKKYYQQNYIVQRGGLTNCL